MFLYSLLIQQRDTRGRKKIFLSPFLTKNLQNDFFPSAKGKKPFLCGVDLARRNDLSSRFCSPWKEGKTQKMSTFGHTLEGNDFSAHLQRLGKKALHSVLHWRFKGQLIQTKRKHYTRLGNPFLTL